MIDWVEFGTMIRKARMLRKKGIRELARDLDVSPPTVMRADRGDPVSAEIMLIFCTYFLDIDPRELLM